MCQSGPALSLLPRAAVLPTAAGAPGLLRVSHSALPSFMLLLFEISKASLLSRGLTALAPVCCCCSSPAAAAAH